MYRTIESSFWTDPKVRKLNRDAKYLLLYLITNPHSHVSGIYLLPHVLIPYETGFTEAELHTLFDTLSNTPSIGNLAQYDYENEVVFVKNMLHYQGRGKKNHVSAANQLKTLHQSPLIICFLKRYPQISKFLPDGWIDTLSHRVSDRYSQDFHQEQEQEQEQEQDLDQKDVCAAKVPLKDGSEYPVEPEFITDLKATFPLIDIDAELKRLVLWNKANPAKQKTKRGIKKHINSWMTGADHDRKKGKKPSGTTSPNRDLSGQKYEEHGGLI